VSPVHDTGPAPAAYTFSFSIDASGPVEAEWVLVSQADTAWESGKIVFTAVGTKDLLVPVKIGVGNWQHWEGAGHLEVVVGNREHADRDADDSGQLSERQGLRLEQPLQGRRVHDGQLQRDRCQQAKQQ
jgi:hypothetical protein